MKNVTEIRANSDFWNKTNKDDAEIQTTATIKEIMDGFASLSDIQAGLEGGFISAETAIAQINHAKKHLLNAVDSIDPEQELRRNTMFVGFYCDCED